MENGTIKSFKLRGTRITAAQTAARDRLWGRYGINYGSESLNFSETFPSQSRFVMEIGFGMGEATAEIARRFPETGFLAVDVHQPGVGKLLALSEEFELLNIRVIDEDALLVLKAMIPDESLDAIHLFFPDPWPKTRHHKRRIINSEFLDLASSKLKAGGSINIATDWAPYAKWIADVFSHSTKFKGGLVDRPEWRPLTRFETQGLGKKHIVTDMSYKKI